jgi:hypothetical protein
MMISSVPIAIRSSSSRLSRGMSGYPPAGTQLPNDCRDCYYADGTGEVLREVHTETAEFTGDVAYALTDYTP